MQFGDNSQTVRLIGIQGGAVQLASKKELAKLSYAAGKGTCTMIVTEQPTLQLGVSMKNKELDQEALRELQGVLDHFHILFEEPKGLPPRRQHDHQIPLKDETQIVKIRPYP